MKFGNRKETLRGLFTLVLVFGLTQFIVFLHSGSRLSGLSSRMRIDVSRVSYKVKPVSVQQRNTVQTQTAGSGELKSKEGPVVNPGTKHPSRNASRHTENHAGARKNNTTVLVPPLRLSPHSYVPPGYDPLIFGKRRTVQGFLTIGIPSISRPNTDDIYLHDTIRSVINTTTPDQRTDITVVIMLSDENETYNNEIALSVYGMFKSYCDDGFIQIINPPEAIYPDFNKLKRTRHDPLSRVKWRTKQNIDFSYMFLYSIGISRYYIQLEDDLICAENFSLHIRQQIDTVSTDWAMLEFSRLGFIGKLFKNKDLFQIANILLSNFDTKPGDLLLGNVLRLRNQTKPIYSNYSLFQHNGKFSSLLNKLMPSIDKTFKDFGKNEPSIRRLPEGIYPKAKIITTFEPVLGYPPSYAYDGNSSTFFWAKKIQRTEYLSLMFETPQNFSRIVISTGHAYQSYDSLMYSSLIVGTKSMAGKPKRNCAFQKIADFVDGEIDTKAMGILIPRDVTCLRIQPFKSNKTWVIFREIVLIP